MQIKKLAIANIDKNVVIAGSYDSIKYTLKILHPIDDTGYIKIVFRIVSDFGIPQFDNPQGDNYCSISTTGDCELELRWDRKGNKRPWGKSLYLKIMKGYLDNNDIVTIIFGDKSFGSRGWKLQTFCEDTFEFKTLIDHIATYQFIEIENSPTVKIIPDKPVKAVCIAPSQIISNTKFSYYLKLEDYWGNPINKLIKYTHEGFINDSEYVNIDVLDDNTGLSAISNPIRIVKSTELILNHYWADFHGQSEESVGTNTIDDYFTFARDSAMLDICGHQANDFQVTDEFWDKINSSTDNFYTPGKFVTFPGYEWSGNTPLGGDRNIYFINNKGIISRSSEALLFGLKTKYLSSPTADKLFLDLRKQEVNSFAFAHVGGRYANLDMHDEEIEIAIEIHSAWGTFEWLLHDAFDRGYRVGICANSDGHKGRPGASYPGRGIFGSYGGVTCVLSTELNRDNIFKAMKNRHFYATTGNRPIIDFKLNHSNGIAMIGDIIEITNDKIELLVNIIGTAPIENVDIFNGKIKIKTLYPYTENDLGNRIKILWEGAEKRGRARHVNWDGSIKLNDGKINGIKSINFWNPDETPSIIASNLVSWKSKTTGGITGLIIELDYVNKGSIAVNTSQGDIECDLNTINMIPKIWEFGGIKKQISIYRIPDDRVDNNYSFKITISINKIGDNPIYIRVNQEDGHMAWTSPVYVIRSE